MAPDLLQVRDVEYRPAASENVAPYRMMETAMRLTELALAMEKNECPCLSVLRMSIVKDDEGLQFWSKKADEYGWEGVMLRKNTTYKGKRSKDLLKVKTFHDAEYTVEGVEMGPFRYVKDGAE